VDSPFGLLNETRALADRNLPCWGRFPRRRHHASLGRCGPRVCGSGLRVSDCSEIHSGAGFGLISLVAAIRHKRLAWALQGLAGMGVVALFVLAAVVGLMAMRARGG
jgi:hypothetical protein